MKPNRKKIAATYPDRSVSVVSVREGKAQFSALVARAAAGEEITIAWHGQPRARLAPIPSSEHKLQVDRDWLRSMPVKKVPNQRAEVLIRTDRDSRG